MKKTEIPYFANKQDLYKFLIENKTVLIAEKKSAIKYGDQIAFVEGIYDSKGDAIKANNPVVMSSIDQLKVKIAINTTNLLDSHLDVHIPGLWKKSLSENKAIMHLQEHKMQFDKIISDGKELKAYAKKFSWAELGYDFEGDTEALVFESTILKKRNAYMLETYANGYVKNHSVGMQYVSMVMCINDDSEWAGAEYEAWQKYIKMVANREAAEASGYFWAIKEAKVIEGSAVPIGSNYATPTIDNNMKNEPPSEHSETEPLKDTRVNYDYLLNNLNF